MICYSFADIGIAFELDNLIESPCFGRFRLDEEQFNLLDKKTVIPFRAEPLPDCEGLKLLYATDEVRCYIYGGGILRVNSRYDGGKYACGFVNNYRGEKYFIADEKIAAKIHTSAELFRMCDLSALLLENDAIILHSSYILVNGKAVLFSAPSGTGKSTQAALWEKYRGARTINGDRSLLKYVDGKWHVFGVPYCGSSQICENESAELAGIAILSQGKTDTVSEMRAIEKIRLIMPEISAQSRSAMDMNNALNLVMQLVAQAKIVHFSCTMEKSAVECLEKAVLS